MEFVRHRGGFGGDGGAQVTSDTGEYRIKAYFQSGGRCGEVRGGGHIKASAGTHDN